VKVGDAWASVDPLGEALHFLRMSGTLYCRSELTEPWGLALPPMEDCLMFHFPTSGRCWLEVEGVPPGRLQPGDLALVPHGRGHRLVSEPGVPATPLFDLPREEIGERYEILHHGGGGAATSLVCGAVRFDHPAAHHLVSLLPRVITVEASRSPYVDSMQSALRFMAEEARALRPGGETVITRLADILVIQAIRSWIDQDPAARTGWLGALQDPQIGRAIALIHRDPGQGWTVASLAAAAAMSRSAFAARFTELVGEPAMRYLTRFRMQVALTWLKEDDARLGDLASRLGYQSEAAFSRAFKRFFGTAPGAIRRGSADRTSRSGVHLTPAARAATVEPST
jgi:AraC-like DNA-binding protein